MGTISLSGVYGASNALIPKNGPKVAKATLDFGNVTEIVIDGQQIVSQGHIEYFQGFYVDNDTDAAITFIMSTTKQRIIIPARTQGYYNLLVPNNPKIRASMPQGVANVVDVIFYNVPIQAHTWSTQ